MTTETKVGGEEQVNEEVPTPKFTETSRDSATSALDPVEIAKQVADILRPDFEKMAQSTKDKRIAALEKKVGSLAELEEMGVTIPENVKTEYRQRELDQRIKELESRGTASTQNSQGSGKVETSEWSRIIDEVGLDTKSPEYIGFMRQEFRNLDHFEAEANRLKRRMDSKPNPSIETSPSLNGKLPVQKDDAALLAELQELQKTPTKNQKRMAEIEEKLGWK